MMGFDKKIQVWADEKKAKDLRHLAESVGISTSMAFRELIPHPTITDALIEFNLLNGNGKRTAIMNISLTTMNFFKSWMMKDRQYPIGLQVELLTGGLDPELKTALLYVRWAKAKRGVDGYRFELVPYKGKARFNIVIGPDDSDEAIEALKQEIIEYAEKLGL